MIDRFVLILAQSASMVLPIVVSGAILIASIKRRWFEGLNRPLDFGATFRGRRLLGEGKTIRGLVVHVFVATLVVVALHSASPTWWLAPQYGSNPLVLGLTLSLFYVGGELVNSFVKRRLGIDVGQVTRGPARLQRFIDNVDGSMATGIPLLFVYRVPWELLVTTGVLGYALHEITDALMRRLRLKDQK